MWAPAILSLALIAAHQHTTNRLHAWPSWRQLSGGGGGGSAGWFAATVELVAVAPVLLLPTLCHVALHPVQVGCPILRMVYFLLGSSKKEASCPAAAPRATATEHQLHLPNSCHLQRAHLRPGSAAGMRGAAGTALLYSASMAALLAVCCCALFGRAVQVGLVCLAGWVGWDGDGR